MTIDDRGRSAADALTSSVQAQVDTEQALADLELQAIGAPRSGSGIGGFAGLAGRQRQLVAVAATLVVLIAVTAAVAWQGGSEGTDSNADRDKRLEDLLPSSAIDGKATMRLPVLVDPQRGIEDGEAVHVVGRGFEPNETVGVLQCGSEADTSAAGIAACQLGEGFSRLLATVSADSAGFVSADVKVTRLIVTEGKGRIDCAEVAERCLIAIGAADNYDRSGGAYLLFVGAPPFPTPRATVSPATDLAGGQRVAVSATGLIPGRTYTVRQCLGDRCVLRNTAVAGLDGSAATGITVYPSIRDAKGEAACDDRCAVVIGGYGTPGGSSAPFPEAKVITFDPSAPLVSAPLPTTTTTTTTPDRVTTTGSPTSPSLAPPMTGNGVSAPATTAP